ncbi:MAG TPA: arylsulfotransferase family protein [Solirubrobacteraceae bacterium]|nr:arylsulfotransferase family protein [Solirubrobacteraceae bacterium]
MTRRRLLAFAGAGTLGFGALATRSFDLTDLALLFGASTYVQTFRSRPDLKPPKVAVTQRGNGVSPGLVFLSPYSGPNQGGAMIVDNQGELVWFHPHHQKQTTNFRIQDYRGKPVLTWWEGIITSTGHGKGDYVLLDDSYREVARVKAGRGLQGDLHEFLLTPQQTALATMYRSVPADLSAAGGSGQDHLLDSMFQEIDVQTGRVLLEWHSVDHVAVEESYAQFKSGPFPFDYFHINSIDVDLDGNLLVSARNTHAVYKINRQTGAIMWRLGGKRSDFSMGPGATFAWQHDARRHPDGTITIFDDGALPAVEKESRGLVLTLDEQQMVATLAREYQHPTALLSGSQGNLQVLPTQNVLVGWGAEPYVSEFDQAGRLLFDAQLPSSEQSYRAFRFPWSARPTEAPAMAVDRRGGDRVTVYASWNGATEVTRWVVLGGRTPSALKPLRSRARAGFETAIGLRTRHPYLAVRAIDSTGEALGESRTARI